MNEANNNSLSEETNKQLEEVRNKIKEKYPNIFEIFEKYYNNFSNANSVGKSDNELFSIFEVIAKYEKYSTHVAYQLNSIDIYNLSKIYLLYYQTISKDKEKFIIDLLYLYKGGWIEIYNPNENSPFFKKNVNYLNNIVDVYYFIEKMCEIYESIRDAKIEINAIIYFTGTGEQYRKEFLGSYLIDKAFIQLDTLKNENNNFKQEQEKLIKRMENFNVEMITIISIIISIAPLIAINISELKEFNVSRLLLINGSLILGITTIFSMISLTFFQTKKKHILLTIPLIISIALIIISFIVPK